jgi:hypothetical protein
MHQIAGRSMVNEESGWIEGIKSQLEVRCVANMTRGCELQVYVVAGTMAEHPR